MPSVVHQCTDCVTVSQCDVTAIVCCCWLDEQSREQSIARKRTCQSLHAKGNSHAFLFVFNADERLRILLSMKLGVFDIFSCDVPICMQNEKLWLDISTSFQNTYRGPYDSDLLATLSPLLVVTLVHSRRSIKSQAVQFWTATFGKSSRLEYPDELKPVLEKARRKSTMVLPGWAPAGVTVVDDTPVSQMTQGQSQVSSAGICMRTVTSHASEGGPHWLMLA